MQCPAADAELTSHTTQGEQGLTVSYYTCPACRGYWMDSFAANFIKSNNLKEKTTPTGTSTYHCPVCSAVLTRSRGDNIPDEVSVFDCPGHHGYFFPSGQLAAFKKAQKTKIEYHKLWNIPMPNVASILLGSFLLLLLSGGLAVTFRGLQQRQITQSQAKQILTDHVIYTASDHSMILIAATTGVDAALTVHIPTYNGFISLMQTNGKRVHQITIPNMKTGTYQYFFTIALSDKEIQSDTFTFTIP